MDGPGAAVLPQVDVVLGVEGHHPLAGGAGGGLDAYAVLQGLGQQTVGIGVPQVGFGHKGQLIEILRPLDVLRGHPLGLHLLAVVGHIVPHVLDLLDQALILPSLDLLPRGGLDLGLVVPFHWDHPFLNLFSAGSFAAAAASFFLDAQKETKEAPGGKLRMSALRSYSLTPWTPFYGGRQFGNLGGHCKGAGGQGIGFRSITAAAAFPVTFGQCSYRLEARLWG